MCIFSVCGWNSWGREEESESIENSCVWDFSNESTNHVRGLMVSEGFEGLGLLLLGFYGDCGFNYV